jgi:uncharacterized membrane protein
MLTPLRLMVIVNLSIGLLMASLLWLMPGLTRPDLCFSVTVTPQFRSTPSGVSIVRRYRAELFAVSLPALAALAVCSLPGLLRFTPVAFLAQIGLSFLVFYRARARVLPHAVAPTSIREAEPHFRARRVPGGWPLACGPFVLLAACAGYLWLHWQRIPLHFPVHWGLDGIPDRWTVRRPASVYLPLLSMAAALLPMTLLLYGITHWVRRIHAGGPSGAREYAFRRTASIVVLAVEYALALQGSWIALHPLLPDARLSGAGGAIMLLLPLLVVIVSIIALVRLGQGGSRSAGAAALQGTSAEPAGDRTDDRYWLLGVIYFNRDDPAVLVEKRFGIGYTLNLARPLSWTILAAIVLLPLALIRFLH